VLCFAIRASFLTSTSRPLTGDHLLHIIQQFEDLISLPNICSVIDGTYIPLAERQNKRYIVATTYYYN
jgi:hypothetical protein